jgi:hypothetical protein
MPHRIQTSQIPLIPPSLSRFSSDSHKITTSRVPTPQCRVEIHPFFIPTITTSREKDESPSTIIVQPVTTPMVIEELHSLPRSGQYLSEEPSIITSLSRMLQIDHQQIRDQCFPITRFWNDAHLGVPP